MLAVEMRHITKRFPGVLADDDVSFDVRQGEIHALMGENGAGKSVLMSILSGLYRPDSGEILVDGRPVKFASPLDAIGAGIGMVFQSFKLFPSLTVAENVVFREEPTRHGLYDKRAAAAIVTQIAERYGLAVDPAAVTGSLPVGVLQRVEIIKALYRKAKVLILDEPTAVLTPQETDRLFEVLRSLQADGHTIILITHKMREVMAISERVTVLRDGRVVARLNTAETTGEEITRLMTGRDIDLEQSPPKSAPGAPVLEVSGLTCRQAGQKPAVDNVSLTVRAGEIVGIAGVAGNGQSELAEAIAGLRAADAGTVRIAGTDVTAGSVKVRRAAGLSYIPEDRHAVGTAPDADVASNLAMGHHRRPPLLQHGLLKRARLADFAQRLVDRFGIKVAGTGVLARTLSGGNLQKIVVARELDYASPLLIAEQPTRGVDIGAIAAIHKEIADYRDGGGGVLLISAELSEILSLSGRILVMFEGRIVADLEAAATNEAELGLLMAGGELAGAGKEAQS
ncbi:MAG: ABC transporter ATP-binding protein [Bifidobacteriaceae bacterium]|jgi:simple sugar transport system ATP-binding protein|nr:ABC transporter ATP-binding protein [Bifidobacteriaceae bacterium]